MLHLNALGFDIWDTILAFLCAQALITILVLLLELQIRRRPRTSKNSNPILEDIALGERSMPVSLGKLVRVEIFSGGLSTPNQKEMVRPERCGVWDCNDTVDHHGPGHSPFGDCSPEGDVFSRHVDQNVCQTRADQEKCQEGAKTDECKEIAIVPATNTIVEPHAVMVESFDTIVADTTVIAARRSPYITCLAVLHRHIHGSHIGSSKLDHNPVICRWTKRQRIVRRI